METNNSNLSDHVVKDDYEAFAEQSNNNDIAERLGGPVKAASKIEVEKPKEPAAAPKVEAHKKSPGQLGFRELRNRVRELEARLAERETPEREVVEEPEAPAPKELGKRPGTEDKNEDGSPKYKTWSEYEDALLEWNTEKVLRTIDERNSKKAQEAQVQAINKTIEESWKSRVEESRKLHEDFDDALDPNGVAKLIRPGSIVDEWIMDSEVGAEILYYFHHNPAELKKFENVPGATPGAVRARARKMLVEIESKINAKESDEPNEAEEVVELPAKKAEVRITRTPPPSAEVGGRRAAPADRARHAVANDDVGAYMDEMDRRDVRAKFGDRGR